MQAAGMQKKNGGDNDGFPTVGVQQQPFCGDITGCNIVQPTNIYESWVCA